MSKKLFGKFFVFLLVVGLLFAVSPTKQALAQTGPTITTVPVAGATVCGTSANTTTTIEIMVSGVVDAEIYGYQVELDYDPSQVTIDIDVEPSPIVNGGYLPEGGFSAITNDTTTGLLSIGYSLLRPTEPVTAASGKLVTITMTHVGNPGTVALDLVSGTTLTDRDGIAVTPASISGATITRESPVVAIGSTEYCDLQSAVTAAVGGDTLTVLRNFTADATVDITKQLTFNTAGKTVSFNPVTDQYYMPIFYVKAGGNLTITGSGTLNSVTDLGRGSAVRVSAGGDLTLDGATLAGGYSSLRIDGNTAAGGDERLPIDSTFTLTSGTLSDGLVIFGKGAEATIQGGLVQSETENAAITGNGTNDTSGNFGGTKINITGGSVRNEIDAAIFHPQDGDLIITGGWVHGATGIVMKSGNLDISGPSNIYADGLYAEPIVSGSGQNSTGDAILIYGGAGYEGDITVNIHANDIDNPEIMGQVTSEYGFTIREFSDTTTDTRTNSVLISGGTFEALEFDENKTVAGNFLFTEQLRNRALADEPNDTLLLTGGYYVDLYDVSPAYYVFPPLETYFVEYPELHTSGYRIRAMYPFAILRGTETLLFPTLKDAVDGANAGETISLRLDHTATCPDPAATVTKAVTIELNGFDYVWPCAVAAYDAPLVVDTGGALTIQDSSTGKTGSIKGSSTGGVNGIALKVSGGIATLSSGTLKGDYVSVQVVGMAADAQFDVIGGTITDGIVVFGPKATLNISGGEITSDYFAPITGNGNPENHGTTINISGGTITFPTDVAIYHPQVGTLNITGGTISGVTGIALKAGTLNISGDATIIGTGPYTAPVVGTSGQDANGSAILIYGGTGYTGVIDVNITGGTISSEQGYAVEEFIKSTDTVTRTTIDISGGTLNSGSTGTVKFTNALVTAAGGVTPNAVMSLIGGWYEIDPAAFVYSPYRTYHDAGKNMYGIQAIPPVINTRTNTEYFDLQLAVNEAEPSDTLKFQVDYTIPATVTINKKLTLDTNGKTISRTVAIPSNNSIVVGPGGDVTIVGGGTITATSGTVIRIEGTETTLAKATLVDATLYAPSFSVAIIGNQSYSNHTPVYQSLFEMTGGHTNESVIVQGNGAEANITGGTLTGTPPVMGNGTVDAGQDINNGGTKITIGGTAVVGDPTLQWVAIYHPQEGLLTVNGGTIQGNNGIEMKAGDLVITGGIIKGWGAKVACADPTATGNGSTNTGDAILIFNRNGYGVGQTMDVTISGTPEITSTSCYALREYTLTGETSRLGVATITGGTFTGLPAAVSFTTNTDANLELLPGGLYNTNPAAFVYVPYGAYLDTTQDPDMYGIRLLPTISGLVTMQGRLNTRAGVPLALDTTAYTATSNEMTDINYYFIGVELGPYTFTTSQPRYLNIMANISVNDLANMQLPSLRLLGGDVNQDYKISVADASDVGTAWGSTANPEANINYDGIVNIQDLALVGGNFGLNRESAYPGWNVVPMPVP